MSNAHHHVFADTPVMRVCSSFFCSQTLSLTSNHQRYIAAICLADAKGLQPSSANKSANSKYTAFVQHHINVQDSDTSTACSSVRSNSTVNQSEKTPSGGSTSSADLPTPIRGTISVAIQYQDANPVFVTSSSIAGLLREAATAFGITASASKMKLFVTAQSVTIEVRDVPALRALISALGPLVPFRMSCDE